MSTLLLHIILKCMENKCTKMSKKNANYYSFINQKIYIVLSCCYCWILLRRVFKQQRKNALRDYHSCNNIIQHYYFGLLEPFHACSKLFGKDCKLCNCFPWKTQKEQGKIIIYSALMDRLSIYIGYHAGGQEFNFGPINTQDLKITEEKVLPL